MKCREHSALLGAGICAAATRGPGIVLDCSSHIPLSSMPVSAGMFCPHQAVPLPHWRNLLGREEETLGVL